MLRPFTKNRKKIKNKLLNQKIKYRNNSKSNTSNSKSKTSIKHHNKKEREHLINYNNNALIYNIEKRQKLKSIKESSNKVNIIMNNLGESLKTLNTNLNSESNPLMLKNLTNISFRRSLRIRNKIKNIDKMNEEFDKEYSGGFNLNDNIYRYSNLKLKQFDEENEKRYRKEKNLRDANFRKESTRILNYLYKKGEEGSSFSEYKKNKKLNELKTSIDYICGVDTRGRKGNSQNEPSKIPHYTEQIRSPSFIREKSKNANFTPSIKYNKSKVYYNKKYELSQEKMEKSKKYMNRISSTIQISPSKKKVYKIKESNIINKTEQNDKNLYKTDIPLNEPDGKDIFKENIDSNKKNSKFPHIQKGYDKNLFKNMLKRRNNLFIFSPKERHPSLESNLLLSKKYNYSQKSVRNRCKTASNNIDNFIKEYNSINKTKKKKFFPLIKDLLNDNYNLKYDLKLGFNIINNMINDFKKSPKKKDEKIELDINKIRKDLKLNNMNNVVDEIDVVMNNVRKMEKLVKKKDIYLLRNVAKTVLREDILANKNLLFDNNSLNSKLMKIYERKNKNTNPDDEMDENSERQQKIEMIKLFKNDGPDFCNENYLASLIKRYKTLKIK